MSFMVGVIRFMNALNSYSDVEVENEFNDSRLLFNQKECIFNSRIVESRQSTVEKQVLILLKLSIFTNR